MIWKLYEWIKLKYTLFAFSRVGFGSFSNSLYLSLSLSIYLSISHTLSQRRFAIPVTCLDLPPAFLFPNYSKARRTHSPEPSGNPVHQMSGSVGTSATWAPNTRPRLTLINQECDCCLLTYFQSFSNFFEDILSSDVRVYVSESFEDLKKLQLGLLLDCDWEICLVS